MPFLFDSCIFPYFQPLNMLSPCPFESCLESRENLVPLSSCERAGSNSSMAFAHDVPSLMNELIYFDWHSAEKFRMLPNTLIRKFLEPDPPVWKLDVYAAKRSKMQSKTNCHSPLNLPHKIRVKLSFFSIVVSNLCLFLLPCSCSYLMTNLLVCRFGPYQKWVSFRSFSQSFFQYWSTLFLIHVLTNSELPN